MSTQSQQSRADSEYERNMRDLNGLAYRVLRLASRRSSQHVEQLQTIAAQTDKIVDAL